MLRIKDKEISRLETYSRMRDHGLKCSATMLEYDTKSFLDFFN